jgi:hypothetical protein
MHGHTTLRFVTSLHIIFDMLHVQWIDSEVAWKLPYFLLPAEIMRCLVGECNVIPNCGCIYTQKGDVMLRFQAIF